MIKVQPGNRHDSGASPNTDLPVFDQPDDANVPLRFLWLELTNKCNLACAHCYAESGPQPSRKDVLTTTDYRRLLEEAAVLGCRSVQFIGGEPTLHRGLPELISHARRLGYDTIEVFSNGTVLPDSLLSCFAENRVRIAVSVYADDPDVHDAVTGRIGSHRKTIANLQRMAAAGLEVRIGVIAMNLNKDHVERTLALLRGLGFEDVSVDDARKIGRGENVSEGEGGLQALCGHCWRGSLCVAPDATVSPCVFSKAWSVGSAIESDLSDLVGGSRLREVRDLIRTDVWMPRQPADNRQDAIAAGDCSPTDVPQCCPTNIARPISGFGHARSARDHAPV
jgi:MoaA/NifB/PqqE/SkfB family radical SAM enzyme